MTDAIADRYRRLGAAYANAIADVPPDRWTAPSPCEDWTARDVVRHVVDTQGMFLGFIGREIGPGPSVDDDPLGAWTHARDQVQAALDDPDVAAQEFDGYAGRQTFARAANRFLNLDLVVHRWDLARATGGDEHLADDELDFVEERIADLGDMMHTSGATRAPLDPPEGADRQTRVLARLGRRAW